jgi:hypothetical protein
VRGNGIKRYLGFIGTCVKEIESDRSIEFLKCFMGSLKINEVFPASPRKGGGIVLAASSETRYNLYPTKQAKLTFSMDICFVSFEIL